MSNIVIYDELMRGDIIFDTILNKSSYEYIRDKVKEIRIETIKSLYLGDPLFRMYYEKDQNFNQKFNEVVENFVELSLNNEKLNLDDFSNILHNNEYFKQELAKISDQEIGETIKKFFSNYNNRNLEIILGRYARDNGLPLNKDYLLSAILHYSDEENKDLSDINNLNYNDKLFLSKYFAVVEAVNNIYVVGKKDKAEGIKSKIAKYVYEELKSLNEKGTLKDVFDKVIIRLLRDPIDENSERGEHSEN